MTPISLGTFIFLCGYPQKERRDIINALCQIAFTILAYVMLIVFMVSFSSSYYYYASSEDAVTLLLFYIFLVIAYFWGILFGGILLCKSKSVPIELRMPLATNIHHVNFY